MGMYLTHMATECTNSGIERSRDRDARGRTTKLVKLVSPDSTGIDAKRIVQHCNTTYVTGPQWRVDQQRQEIASYPDADDLEEGRGSVRASAQGTSPGPCDGGEFVPLPYVPGPSVSKTPRMLNPGLTPSLLFATSGTPRLTSTRTGSSLYTSPTPAEIDGFEMLPRTLSISVFARTEPARSAYTAGRRTKGHVHLSSASRRPALTNARISTGQMRLARDVRDQARARRPIHVAAERIRWEECEHHESASTRRHHARPSRGPMPFARSIRTLTGPPSWNRSENGTGRQRLHSSPDRAANDIVYMDERQHGAKQVARTDTTDQTREQRPGELCVRLRLVEQCVAAEPRELLEELEVRPARAKQPVVARVARPGVRHGRVVALQREDGQLTAHAQRRRERCAPASARAGGGQGEWDTHRAALVVPDLRARVQVEAALLARAEDDVDVAFRLLENIPDVPRRVEHGLERGIGRGQEGVDEGAEEGLARAHSALDAYGGDAEGHRNVAIDLRRLSGRRAGRGHSSEVDDGRLVLPARLPCYVLLLSFAQLIEVCCVGLAVSRC
ncbi:hypothetical protein B0H21DRAFT_709180 [Amylocystis lapponica]|nr:hypothetical protein B0H21DRAFT_709180 [Amylocystis lapponica]